jgi:hypothetical protein
MNREELKALEYKSWKNAMEGFRDPDSVLSKLLTIHLITETVLDQIVGIALGHNCNAVLSLSLSYKQKLDLCSKLVFDDGDPCIYSGVVGSLRKLNSLRNRCSHRLHYEIEENEILELFDNIVSDVPADVRAGDIVVKIESYYAFILPMMYRGHADET